MSSAQSTNPHTSDEPAGAGGVASHDPAGAGGVSASDAGGNGSPIGRSQARFEDKPLLTGRGEFIDDLQMKDTLHVRFVRSPLAYGRLEAIDLDDARRAPGVVAVFTAADLDLPPLIAPIANPAAFSPARPLLAEDVVRFVGEPLAVVVAESPYQAEDGAALVQATIARLAPATDAETAIAAPPMHAHDSNVLYDYSEETGEVDAAFASAAVVVERTFHYPRSAAMPIEPRGVLAVPDGDGVRMWASTQVPHSLADITAETLGLAEGQVRVSASDVGGGFGQKAHAYPEEIISAWLALRLQRPVKWLEDRSDNLLSSSHARDQVVHVRAAAADDGQLLAIDADVICDVGAYGVFPHGHLLEPLGTPGMIPGPYRLSTYRSRSRAVATNKCPEGAYRGVGLPVSAFVHERLMDLLATELRLDRAEIRRRNLIDSQEMPYVSIGHHRYDSGDYAAALSKAVAAIGYLDFPSEQAKAREQGRLLGLGLSCYVEYSGMGSVVFQGRGMVGIPGYDSARIELNADGGATVWTSLPAIGQGVATTFAQITAADLGLEVEAIKVARADTGVASGGGTGTYASRSAIMGGGAIAIAAGELRQRLIDDAAEKLEVSRDDLELVGGRVSVRGSRARGVDVGEIVAADEQRFQAKASFDPPLTAYPYAAHACTVEVDPETGGVRILRYVVVEDCGRRINPLIIDGQVHGATAQGIGGALLEHIVYDSEGQLLTASLMDYLVPTAAEMPAFEVGHLEIPAPDSPNGAKGVGEGGTLAPGGALANAVSNALGAELNALPLAPDLVRAAARRGENGGSQQATITTGLGETEVLASAHVSPESERRAQ